MRMHVGQWKQAFAIMMAGLFAVVSAAGAATVRGTVVDALGQPIAGAKVAVQREGVGIKETSTGTDGRFAIDALDAGRYVVLVSAEGFETSENDAIVPRGTGATSLEVALRIGALRQDVTVTAAVSGAPTAQVGAAVTVLDDRQFQHLGVTEVLEPLRGVPGAAVVQAGQRGSPTGFFVRGGSSNFNKVLIDGLAVNEIGGAFDFANLATTGVGRVEVLRGANSVGYGTDAMTGVVDITTRQGRTSRPEGEASFDFGNLSTVHSDLSLGGTARAVDYFAAYGHLDTDNSTPNADFGVDTFSARVGASFGGRTSLSGTLRWLDSDVGSPNAFSYFGIADDSRSARGSTVGTVTARTQFNDRWQSTIRVGVTSQDYHYLNPTPSGTPTDSSAFANYLGNVVTINGANGYSVTGRAILDYGGAFPSNYLATNDRTVLSGQTDYQVRSGLNLAGGVRVEHEDGTAKGDFDLVPKQTTRNNLGAFVEGRGSVGSRVFVTAGLGFDNNAVFGNAVTPRLSLAAYLRPPSRARVSETKLTFNAGRGIKAPTLDQALQSVYTLIPESVADATGIEPIGPERSRTFDVGVEQGFAGGHARVRASYFDSQFTGVIEYLSKGVLPQLGVAPAAIAALSFGAYANAQSNESRGLELSFDAALSDLSLTAAYTYLDATVTESLSSGVLFPMENPSFPGIQIGQYTPLVGNRPFRRPANSGSLVATYVRDRLQLTLAGFFFGTADDSTFLSDAFFGASMLLPNQDLAAAYQKYDLGASYRFHRSLRWYLSAENLFDRQYQAASGYPSLPRVVRTGVTVSLGGDTRP